MKTFLKIIKNFAVAAITVSIAVAICYLYVILNSIVPAGYLRSEINNLSDIFLGKQIYDISAKELEGINDELDRLVKGDVFITVSGVDMDFPETLEYRLNDAEKKALFLSAARLMLADYAKDMEVDFIGSTVISLVVFCPAPGVEILVSDAHRTPIAAFTILFGEYKNRVLVSKPSEDFKLCRPARYFSKEMYEILYAVLQKAAPNFDVTVWDSYTSHHRHAPINETLPLAAH